MVLLLIYFVLSMCIFITQFELLDTRHCYAMLFAVRRFELLDP